MGSILDTYRQNENSLLGDLTTKITKEEKKASYTDERFWKPTADDKGTGFAIIRFLPSKETIEALTKGSKNPIGDYITYYDHVFKNPANGKWYFENCPTSLGVGTPCPVCKVNSVLWNSGIPSDVEIARIRKRKIHIVANVYVIQDKANPDAEGKIFLYSYGTKIGDMIKSCSKPEFEDQIKFNPFSPVGGANFKLKFKLVKGQRSYDASSFDVPAPVSDDDVLIEKLLNNVYPLAPFISQDYYKPFEELEKKFKDVLALESDFETPQSSEQAADSKSVSFQDYLSKFEENVAEEPF